MANVNLSNSKPSTVNVPVNYPMEPTPGKISLLFEANSTNLYHRFNANDYDGGSVLFGSSQPYLYRYPDDPPSDIRQFGGQGLPLGAGVDDLIRVSKFVGSGRGLLFVGKQLLLQGLQPFDETNIYNPTEVILSATSNLTGGLLDRPKRHIDTSGGLLGGLAALIGVSVSRGSPPPSTVAAGNGQGGSTSGGLFSGFSLLGSSSNREVEVLPVQNYGNGTGLLRAKTANKGRSILQTKWGVGSGGAGGGILGFITNIAKSIIPQVFGSDKQNFKQRADDETYSWMVKYYNQYTAKNQTLGTSKSGLSVGFMGFNLFGGNGRTGPTEVSNRKPTNLEMKYVSGESKYSDVVYIVGDDEFSDVKNNYKLYGFDKGIESLEKQKDTYFDTKKWEIQSGESVIDAAFEKYKSEGERVKSNDLTKDSTYVNRYDENNHPEWQTGFKNDTANAINNRSVSQNTKLNDVSKAENPASQINDSLKRVINNIEFSRVYTTKFDDVDTWLFSSGQTSKQGYDRLYDITKTPFNLGNHKSSIQRTYRDGNVRTLDSIINQVKNYGFAGNGRPDKINTLTVLNKDKKVLDNILRDYTEWKPYDDDLVAFFFYDVVNEKYIPFRNTVKGLSESNNALWDELRFMGRADALYSYTGFTRNLSFSFNVVMNSIAELYPTWRRLNYLAGCVKPASYTKKVHGNITNRFIIPPMFMLTIGDLYKYQPVVITTVNINIPENGSWETLPENTDPTQKWSFLGNIINTNIPNQKIGQVPREVEVSVTCNVLEKERAVVGGNHFGHAPLRDDELDFINQNDTEYMPPASGFSKNIRNAVGDNPYE